MKIGKRLLSLALSAVCAASVTLCGVPVVSAETGTYGELNYRTVDDDNDGTGDYVKITDCDESAASVEIPAEIGGVPVTSIGFRAFYGCKDLESVSIPEGVTNMGYNAFEGCASLESITIPNGVTDVIDYLFFGCESLRTVAIPDGVEVVGNHAFEGCTSLESVEIPDSVTNIGEDAFLNTALVNNQTGVIYADSWVVDCDDSIASASIKDGTSGIAYGAFYECESLESVTIPDSVTSIGRAAFVLCSSLKSISIPYGITSIVDVFSGCTSLESITLPDSLTSIGDSAFGGCTSLESITIPDSVTSIEYWAFDGCTNLKSITLPNSVTSILGSAFSNCTNLKSITLSDSLTSIWDGAFSNCTSLTSITIPESVTSIDDRAFSDCENLSSITILNPDCEIWMSEYTISNSYDWKNDVVYFNGTIYGYENSSAQTYAQEYDYTFEPIGESGKPWCMANMVKMKRYLTGENVEITDNFDLNGDGVVNIFDLILMKREILGG